MLNRLLLIVLLVVLGAVGYVLYRNPPMKAVARGEVGIRFNRLTGAVEEARDGSLLVIPGMHEIRLFSLRDRVYRPTEIARADGASPVQSVEGLSFGVDVSVRYALDANRLRAVWNTLPDNVDADLVQPAVASIVYKVFARYTVREIFSTKRAEIQQAIESELATRLAADGVALRGLLIGKVDLPPDYKRGMESLLAEELASEEDALHARAEGEARQGDRARGRGAARAPREGRRGVGARAGDRRARPGRGDEARPAAEGAAGRTAQARG
jgi:regulator of protease activity HflC (stomatin/prohibitin superfamily)